MSYLQNPPCRSFKFPNLHVNSPNFTCQPRNRSHRRLGPKNSISKAWHCRDWTFKRTSIRIKEGFKILEVEDLSEISTVKNTKHDLIFSEKLRKPMQSDSDKASLDRRQRAPAHAEARLKERGARHVGTLESLLPEAGCNLPRKLGMLGHLAVLFRKLPIAGDPCSPLPFSKPQKLPISSNPYPYAPCHYPNTKNCLTYRISLLLITFLVISALPAWTSFTSSPSVEAASAEAASGEAASANSWGGS